MYIYIYAKLHELYTIYLITCIGMHSGIACFAVLAISMGCDSSQDLGCLRCRWGWLWSE